MRVIIITAIVLCTSSLFSQSNTGHNFEHNVDRNGVISKPEPIEVVFMGETEPFRDIVIDTTVKHPITKPLKLGYHPKGDWVLNETINPNALPQNGDNALQKDYNRNISTNKSTQVGSWDGITTTTSPGDPALDVGPNHVVQMLNGGSGAVVKIWDKTGGVVLNTTLFASLAGTGSGLGDPIVLYDERADRWLLSEFQNGGNNLYIAISTTPDPTGSYFVYSVLATTFPDYPKYSIWDNSYVVTANETGSSSIYIMNRANMLAGSTPNAQRFTVPHFGTIGFQMTTPVSMLGTTVSGTPAMLMRMRDDAWSGSASDALEIWELDVDWSNPGAATLAQTQVLATTPHETELCGYTSFACIPQQGSGTTLDPLREILMNRIMYRNFGTHESIVCAHVTDVNGSDLAGIRWYELRRTGGGSGTWSIYQESTYSPDSDMRWMPTIGLSASGNIGLAYNVSSSSMYPSIRYTGRKECDPLNVMTETEVTLVAGTSPNNTNRWGDYNAMGVDPTDGETFWFTAQYNPASQARTRVGAFTIDNCSPLVQFGASTYTVNETDANVANGCLPYYVLNVPISIGSDPSQVADVTVNVSGGTATQNVDYVINNTSFSFDDPTLSGTVEIWVYNDDYVEGNETITLDYTLNANGGNAANGVINQTVTITINDDDLAPSAMTTTTTILTQDFESGMAPFTTINNNTPPAGNLPWQIGNVGTTPNGAFAIPGDNTTEFAWIDDDDCNCDQSDVDLLFPSINLSNYTSASMSMDSYYENNNWSGNQEVAEVRVSIAGGPFTFVANVITSSIDVSWSSQTIDLTPYVGNSNVQLAINYNDGGGWLYGCAVDNINITGTVPIDIQTAVNAGAGDQANLGPNETVHFYDPVTSDVMMTLVNTSSFDYGCVTVEVDRDGSTPNALQFASVPVVDYLHSKTYTVVPTNTNPTGTFDVTVYYKEAEVSTWEAITGNSRNNAEVIKVAGNNAINDVTPANYTGYTIDNIPATLGSFNSDVTFTSSFTNGFSGFGVGIYNITTVTVTHTTVNTNLTCNGDNSGVIVVTASGGSTPYQYSIDGGTTWQASNTFSGLAAGTYSVIVQDAGSNMSTASSETLTEPTIVTYTSSASNASCNGSNDGTITLAGTGGGGTYQYSVNGGTTFQSSGSFTGLGAATYAIVVEDVNGCQATGTITLTQPTVVSHTSSSTNLTCNGDASGTITLSGSGGSGSIQYSIDGGTSFQSSGSFTGLSAGSYSVVVEDVNSCQSTETIIITQPTIVSYTSSLTNLSCNGDGSGQIVLTGSGGTGSIQYSIDGGTTFQGSGTFSGLNAATYSVVVEDASGCQATGTETLTEPTGVTYTTVNVNPSCNGGADGSISISASGGVNPITYSIDGGTTFQGGSTFNSLAANSYNIVVRDGNGCSLSSTVTLTDPIVISYTTSTSPETCGSSDGAITVSASGGTGSLQYSIDGGTTFQASNSFTGLNAGVYNVVVEDVNSCQATGTVTVGNVGGANITSTSSTPPTCNGDTDATISISATGGANPLQYSIDGGSTFQNPSSFNGLSAGSYSIVVRDGNGCQTTASLTITDPAVVSYTVNISDESCGLGNGIITLNGSGGTGTIQYSINGGTTFQFSGVFNSLSAGAYSVEVEDANGCLSSSTETVGSISGPVINTITETDISCNGADDGVIFIAASGGSGSLQYSINGGTTFQTSPTFNGLAPGVYPITIEDAGGCQATSTSTLTEPTILSSTETTTDATCNGGNDGSGVINATGGSTPYQYSVDGGTTFVSTNTFNGLSAGSYTYIVEDANGCQVNGTAVISQPSALVLGFTNTNPICNGDVNATITMTASGGAGFYQFSIDGGTTFQGSGSFTGLGTGTYNLVLEDGNSCQQTGTVTIAAPAAITYGTSVTAVSCNGNTDGVIVLTGSGGTGALSYSINGGTSFQASGTFNGLSAGSYSIIVQDVNGCQGTGTVTVTSPSAISFTSTTSNPLCNGGNDGAITINAAGGNGSYQYSSDGGATFQASNILLGLSAGTINIAVQDGNGCQTTGSVVLTDPAGMTYSVSSVNENCGLSDGEITITASGGASPLQYSIDGGATFQASNTFINLSAGSYNYIIVDANGCQVSGTEIVNNSSGVSISSTSFTAPICNGGSDGTINIVATGGSAPLQYSIDGGTTFQASASFAGINSGAYNVVVEDASGCQVTSSVNITEPTSVSYTFSSTSENCGLSDGTISLTASGGTGSYQYSIDGGVTFQASGSFSGLTAGTYDIAVEDVNGCQVLGTETLIGSGGASISNVATVDPLCNGTNNGQITVTATGGTAPLQYSIDGGITFQISSTFTGVSAGNYSIVVQDASGCQNSSSAVLNDPAAVSFSAVITNETCGASDGEINITATGGTAPLQYSIDGGVNYQPSNIFTSLTSGTYSVVVEDANGCTATGTQTINGTGGAAISSIGSTDVTCFGSADGTITVTATGGVAPLQYSIDGGASYQSSNLFSGVAAGSYIIVVEDANGCQELSNTTVNSPLMISLTITSNDASCGNNDGDATVTATGGDGVYSYQWDDGLVQTTSTAINLAAGVYNVVVTDGSGCSESAITFVNNIGEPDLSISSSDISCYGMTDGTATASVAGGIAPIIYQWNDPSSQTTAIASNLSAGTYIVQVTDGAGCVDVASVDVNQPDSIVVSTIVNNTTCGYDNGYAIVSVTGGTNPYNYLWDDPQNQTSATALGLGAGLYLVEITDANNCVANDTISVAESDSLIVTVDVIHESCVDSYDGSIETAVSGGLSPYDYIWSNGDTTEVATMLTAGNYYLTVNDANDCSVMLLVPIETMGENCISIPTAISPNGDGSNDLWVISGLENTPDVEVEIYNRWGSLIFSATDYQNDWDGTYLGKNVPAGVYYFIVKLSEDDVYTGSITVLR